MQSTNVASKFRVTTCLEWAGQNVKVTVLWRVKVTVEVEATGEVEGAEVGGGGGEEGEGARGGEERVKVVTSGGRSGRRNGRTQTHRKSETVFSIFCYFVPTGIMKNW